jgi:hypothetical protein
VIDHELRHSEGKVIKFFRAIAATQIKPSKVKLKHVLLVC